MWNKTRVKSGQRKVKSKGKGGGKEEGDRGGKRFLKGKKARKGRIPMEHQKGTR